MSSTLRTLAAAALAAGAMLAPAGTPASIA